MEPKFVGKVKLTKQGQITLPQEARQDLEISLDSDLYWYEVNGALVVVKELTLEKDLLKNITHKGKNDSK